MRQRVTPEQQAVLEQSASRMVAERFQRLRALTESELLELPSKTEEFEVEGVRLRCVTFHSEEAPGLHSFGVIALVDTFRAGSLASSLWLAKEAFWLKDGHLAPFTEDDWREHQF